MTPQLVFMLIAVNMNISRPYAQHVRAESTRATRARILDAVVELVLDRADTGFALADVAGSAEVSVQTVLRHFGSRDRLFDEAMHHASATVAEERRAPVGDPPEDIRILVDHYETRGDGVVGLLAQEAHDPRIAAVVRGGRASHRDWVRTVFAPWLRGLGEAEAGERVRLLVVATDVYSWKLLRRDMGLHRVAAEQHMLRLVTAVLTSEPRLPDPPPRP